LLLVFRFSGGVGLDDPDVEFRHEGQTLWRDFRKTLNHPFDFEIHKRLCLSFSGASLLVSVRCAACRRAIAIEQD
jgi:hypothetical protein